MDPYLSDEEEMQQEQRPAIVDVHIDNQLISVPLELAAPVFNKGMIVEVRQEGILLRSESDAFYLIGRKKNIKVKFGTVYEGRELIYNNELKTLQYKNAKNPDLHIQIVNHHKYMADKETNQKQCDDIMDELSILQYIQKFTQHSNIARLIDCLKDDNYIYSVMEYGGNDLFDVIKYSGNLYSEDHRKKIFSQILDGFSYLQSIGIYHRDISADNILYNPLTGIVKIIDFGMALHIPRLRLGEITDEMMDRNIPMSVNPYSPNLFDSEELIPLMILNQGWYGKTALAPPEMYAQQPLNGYLADSWSLGVLLYFLLNNVYPWNAPLPTDDYFRAIVVDDTLLDILAVTSLSVPAKDLLRTLLRSVNPADRLSIKDMRLHQWLAEELE